MGPYTFNCCSLFDQLLEIFMWVIDSVIGPKWSSALSLLVTESMKERI